MAFNEEQKLIVTYAIEQVRKYNDNLAHNQKLFQIYEGNLLEQILQDVAEQFSEESYKVIKGRIAPINILKRVVDKLSTIYAKSVKRTVIEGTDEDKELLAWYEEQFDMNNTMNIANELYNLHKCTVVEPYIDDMIPKLRAIPSDRSLMLSQDPVDPTRPTMWIKMMGKSKVYGEDKDVIYIYTDKYFLPVTTEGVEVPGVLASSDNPNGENPIGKLTGTYINQSHHCIVPQIDTDLLRMTKIIPMLISDLNYAILFQSFSMVYGIDIDTTNIRMSPNAFVSFKSDPTSTKTPSIGSLKPTVDIQEVVQFIQAQLTFWLNSKNIRPGTIGGLSTENFASGISKAIDEMDTVEARQKQVPEFMKAEKNFWTLITKNLHPYWMENKMINTNLNFSPNVQIKIEFPEQLPMSDRETVLKNVKEELTLKITTRKRAIKTVNPEMSDDEIEELLHEIDEENTQDVVTDGGDGIVNPAQDGAPVDGEGSSLPI